MKRFVLVAAVMMTLAACGDEGSSSSSSPSATSSTTTTVQASAPTSTGKASSAPVSSTSATSTGSTASTPATTQAPAKTQTSAPASVQLSVSGSPAKTATVGNWYAFQPTVAANGAKITFSASNVPHWATFNSNTGELSGTPEADDVGTYANVTIQVSDGTKTIALSPFSIAVSQSDPNSIALSWSTPVSNDDQTPLTNLAGYRVYYGHDQSSMTASVDIANPKARSFELANLPAGEWYVSMVAYSTDGTVSSQSTPMKVSI